VDVDTGAGAGSRLRTTTTALRLRLALVRTTGYLRQQDGATYRARTLPLFLFCRGAKLGSFRAMLMGWDIYRRYSSSFFSRPTLRNAPRTVATCLSRLTFYIPFFASNASLVLLRTRQTFR